MLGKILDGVCVVIYILVKNVVYGIIYKKKVQVKYVCILLKLLK